MWERVTIDRIVTNRKKKREFFLSDADCTQLAGMIIMIIKIIIGEEPVIAPGPVKGLFCRA